VFNWVKKHHKHTNIRQEIIEIIYRLPGKLSTEVNFTKFMVL